MNGTKITVTLSSGKRRVLKAPDTLPTIDGRRQAYFVFDNMQVYTGYTNGEVDEEGDFCVRAANSGPKGAVGIGLPIGRLMGWAYVNPKKSKQ